MRPLDERWGLRHYGVGEPKLKRLCEDEPVKVYGFFKEEFFGIEKTIAQVVRYFHAAALGGEEAPR